VEDMVIPPLPEDEADYFQKEKERELVGSS
jgi:hypothetical protein